ncbi:MAG: MerR family DNA-binding transcriptional regulator, partial [Clostridia bacterium]
MNRTDYYSIGEVASTCNISIRTLRYYDEISLVVPEIRKEGSKYRYY